VWEKRERYFSQFVNYTSLSFFLRKPEILIYEVIFMHLPTNIVVIITLVTGGHYDQYSIAHSQVKLYLFKNN
jgi:hypothetical protein